MVHSANPEGEKLGYLSINQAPRLMQRIYKCRVLAVLDSLELREQFVLRRRTSNVSEFSNAAD